MAQRSKKPRASKSKATDQQAATLVQIAELFVKQAAALATSGRNDPPAGPAAAEQAAIPLSPDDEDARTDDVADRLEWVTDEWKLTLKAFLDAEVGPGSGQKFFELYEAHNYNRAAELLMGRYKAEFLEVARTLLDFRVRTSWIVKSGGNESPVPQALQQLLYPLGWHETRLKGHMVFESHVTEKRPRMKNGDVELNANGFPKYSASLKVVPTLRQLVVDAHKIDHVKGEVAFDMEWNSKDQTFDRDLYAMRLFHEAHLIGAGMLLTRSADLNSLFLELDEKHPRLAQKYGASTTWMGKLLYRLRSSRSGGCPVLALGIKRACVAN